MAKKIRQLTFPLPVELDKDRVEQRKELRFGDNHCEATKDSHFRISMNVDLVSLRRKEEETP